MSEAQAESDWRCNSPQAPEGTSPCRLRAGHFGEHVDSGGGTWPYAFPPGSGGGGDRG